MQIYNESAHGNLKRCLESMTKYCDEIVLYDDGSTDDSLQVARQFTDLIIEGKQNDFSNELFHKQQLLELALSRNPDWIFWMDADEVLEKKGEQGGIRKLCESAGDADSFAFKEVNLWRCHNYYRLDSQYNDGIFCRLWKNNGKLVMNTQKGLHHRQAPMGLSKEGLCDLKVIHYGFASDDNILRKYRTYKSHGQAGWALHRLVDERTLQLAPVDTEWFTQPPAPVNPNDVYRTPLVAKL
jgi:glycosyltransferase involved in cell wall biosynthesis